MTSIIKNKCKGKMTLQPIQKKLTKYFIPSVNKKGILLYHGVGSGKTCSAISMAANFEEDGYTILWVTKRTLLKVVEQNLFGSAICHPKIDSTKLGTTYQQRFGHFNKVTNGAWMTPISYKSFSNLYKKKSAIYKKLVKRNGAEDPFRKTVIIIDEGHNLFAEIPKGISGQERANFSFVQKQILNSYAISGKNSARLIILSATPALNGISGMFQMLNTMLPNTKDHLPENVTKITDELTNKLQKVSKDVISYYDNTTNSEIFAQKQFHKIMTHISKNKKGMLKKCKGDINCTKEMKSNNEYKLENSQQQSLDKCKKIKSKEDKIECMEKTLLWNGATQKYKYTNPTFSPVLLSKRLPIISTRMDALIKNIDDLDRGDRAKFRRTYKHVIYVEKPKYVLLLLNVLIAKGFHLALKKIQATQKTGRKVTTLKINLKDFPRNKNKNVSLFTTATIEKRQIGKNLIKTQRDLWNSRPNKSKDIKGNVYGNQVRFAIIDRNFLEGISFFDAKYIHILSMPDTEHEITQLLGRVIRFCGHTGLPFVPDVGWKINIMLYENYNATTNLDAKLRLLRTGSSDNIESIKKIIVDQIENSQNLSS